MSALNVEEFALTVGHSCRLGCDVVSCFNQPSDVACNREGHGIAFFIDSILFDLITAARPMDDASVWCVESTLKERALNEVNEANPRASSDVGSSIDLLETSVWGKALPPLTIEPLFGPL